MFSAHYQSENTPSMTFKTFRTISDKMILLGIKIKQIHFMF